MSKFEKFLKENSLKKGEVAEYLGIAASNISYYCNGGKVPDAHIKKLSQKWNTALLTEEEDSDLESLVKMLKEELGLLRQIVANQSAVIASYEDIIKTYINNKNNDI